MDWVSSGHARKGPWIRIFIQVIEVLEDDYRQIRQFLANEIEYSEDPEQMYELERAIDHLDHAYGVEYLEKDDYGGGDRYGTG